MNLLRCTNRWPERNPKYRLHALVEKPYNPGVQGAMAEGATRRAGTPRIKPDPAHACPRIQTYEWSAGGGRGREAHLESAG